MNNKYYTYEGIRIWQDGAWDDVISSIAPLCRWIEEKNKELGKYFLSPGGEACTPEGFNFKQIPPEDEALWSSKGMSYYACGLGGIALIPSDFEHNVTEEPETVLCLVQSKKSSPTRVHDILTYNSHLCEMCAAERFAVYFAPTDGMDEGDNYTQVLHEISSLSHMTLKKVWLDVRTVYESGLSLKDVPGFALKDASGNVVPDPDSLVKEIGSLKIPCLDITGIWYERTSQMYNMGHLASWTNGTLDPDRIMHSSMGKRMAEFMCYEHDIENAHDERLNKYWDQYGLVCEFHEHKYDQWISVVPRSALEQTDEKLPLVVIVQDIPQSSAHTPLTAWCQHSGFFNIAGQGDCCLLFFCQEQIEDFMILPDVLDEYARLYPADLSRVYMVGHSHNGGLSSACARRFPERIAAIGTLGNLTGFKPSSVMGPETMAVEDDEVEFMRTSVDVPTVNIVGCSEFMCEYPLYEDEGGDRSVQNKLYYLNRRLRAYRCREFTEEDLEACRNSDDAVIRRLGIPADWTDLLYLDGTENYIADFKNSEGKRHLRMIAMGNLPHTVSPLMSDLVWNFVRRFAKDPETGKCIELY
mgnify:CR=1 FL=1